MKRRWLDLLERTFRGWLAQNTNNEVLFRRAEWRGGGASSDRPDVDMQQPEDREIQGQRTGLQYPGMAYRGDYGRVGGPDVLGDVDRSRPNLLITTPPRGRVSPHGGGNPVGAPSTCWIPCGAR